MHLAWLLQLGFKHEWAKAGWSAAWSSIKRIPESDLDSDSSNPGTVQVVLVYLINCMEARTSERERGIKVGRKQEARAGARNRTRNEI